MKKFLLSIAFLLLSLPMLGQDIVPVRSHAVATNSFWSNWFVSAGGQYTASYTSQEVSDLKFNPFSTPRGEFGFHMALGKWFTPSIGLRTKFEGLWQKSVLSKSLHKSYTYYNLHEDLLLNLSSLLCGYNPRRVWNFTPWLGVGFMRNVSHNSNEFSFNFGLLNTFRLSTRWSAFIDIYANSARGRLDAKNNAQPDAWAAHKTGALRHWDKQLGVAVGLTFHLGKAHWDRVPDIEAMQTMNQEQLDALQASIDELQNEVNEFYTNAANSAEPVATPEVRTDTVFLASVHSVFFELGSSDIANRKELVGIKQLADLARQHHTRLLVTGYTDNQTGTESQNRNLSEARAQAVANELVKMGVSRDLIEVVGAGPSDALTPFFYNRRATVQIK